MTSLRPNATDRNPWLINQYQNKTKCKLRGSFDYLSTTTCEETLFVERKKDIDIYTINMIKALYAFGYALKNLTNRWDVLNRNQRTAEKLRIQLNKTYSPTGDAKPWDNQTLQLFDRNLDGVGGYKVFSMRNVTNKKDFDYRDVYEFVRTKYGAPDKIIASQSSSAKFYRLNEKTGKDETIIFDGRDCDFCSCPKPRPEPSPTPRPESKLIVLSVALASISLALIGVILRMAWKKYGFGE